MGRLTELWEAGELPDRGAWTSKAGGGRYMVVGYAQDAGDDGAALVLYVHCQDGWVGPDTRRAQAVLELLAGVPADHMDPPSLSLLRRLRDRLAETYVDDDP